MRSRILPFIASLTFLSASAYANDPVAAEAEPAEAIEYLLTLVAGSDLEFVRNGKTHTPAQAVEHMRRKYDYYIDDIRSAEDFITLAATKSILSGKPYLVRDASGEVPAADWLLAVLAEYRAK